MRCEEPKLAHALRLADGERLTVRPACPRDADRLARYIAGLSPGARYNRFLGSLKELSPSELARITHLDSRRQFALIVEWASGDGLAVIGEARLALTQDGQSGEI